MIIFTGIIGLTLCTIYMLHMVLLVTFPMSITILLFLITIFVNMDYIILFDSVGLGILCYILGNIFKRRYVSIQQRTMVNNIVSKAI